jgi:short-subunit dehydrogenase
VSRSRLRRRLLQSDVPITRGARVTRCDDGPVRLDGRRALLTGATGGIGQAVARAMSARGAQLVLTGRRSELLEELATATGGRAVAVDLADRGALQRFLEQVGEIDVVVANAGLPASGLLTSFADDEIDRALDVNLRAPIITARHICEQMIARGRGHLVFVSSLSGKMATGHASVYDATKFGLRGFSLALREDLAPSGIGVSAVYPGLVRDAGMFAESGATLPRLVGTSSPEQVAAAVIRAIEKNRAEIDVAPLPMRVGVRLAAVVPTVALAIQRRAGSDRIAASIASGQREKRR